MAEAWTVVKVGGSLFDWRDLRGRLHAFLRQLDADRVLLVPGGGRAADAIRAWDRAHQLGEETSHWLALEALSINARFLQALIPEAQMLGSLAGAAGSRGWHVLDAVPFFREDEASADHLPHGWHVTSDSLAARAAVLLNARELVLLKSMAWDGDDWDAASRAGVVDGFFAEASAGLRVRLVNLRTFC